MPKRPIALLLGLAAAIMSLPSCGDSGGSGSTAGPAATASAVVELQLPGGEGYDVAGVAVYVDGILAGTTDSNGEAHVMATPGVHRVHALEPFSLGGSVDLDFQESSPPAALILLTGAGAALEVSVANASLQEGRVGLGGLPDTLILQDQQGRERKLAHSLDVQARSNEVEGSIDLNAFFEIRPTGELALVNQGDFIDLLSDLHQGIEIRIVSFDEEGFLIDHRFQLRAAYQSLNITLLPPSVDPMFSVSGVSLEAQLIGTDHRFAAETDESGEVRFANLPRGTYELRGEVVVPSGLTYSVREVLLILTPTTAVVSLQDFAAGGLPALQRTSANDPVHTDPRRREPTEALKSPSQGWTAESSGPCLASVSSLGTDANQENVDLEYFAVPAGVDTLTLQYEVGTDEYTTTVLEQLPVNDHWSLGLYDALGSELFYVARNVNAQLELAPRWRTSGVTGSRSVTIQLPEPGPLTLGLRATSTNVGDDLLPTYLTSCVYASTFAVSAIALNPVTPNQTCGPHTKDQEEQLAVSIPQLNGVNSFQRTAQLTLVNRQPGSLIERVEVLMIDANTGTQLGSVLDSPLSTGVVDELAFDHLQVRFTSGIDNPLPSNIGLTSHVTYSFLVELSTGSGQLIAQGNRSVPLMALWSPDMPLTPFGCQESGGDQWMNALTMLWLAVNSPLLPRVAAISGEHGRNHGRDEHEVGADIDAFPFYDAGAQSGAGNYVAFAARLAQAIEGDSAAVADVRSWIMDERQGLDSVLASAPVVTSIGTRFVEQVESSVGGPLRSAQPVINGVPHDLPVGWMRTLRETGALTLEGLNLDLGIGSWSNPSVIPMPGQANLHRVVLR